MRGLSILLGFNLAGFLLQRAGVPLPGNVIGLILFTAALFLKIIKLEWVEGAAHFLLRHMLLFFAPAIISALPLFAEHKTDGMAIAVSLVGSLLTVMLLTGWLVALLLPAERRGGETTCGDDRSGEVAHDRA